MPTITLPSVGASFATKVVAALRSAPAPYLKRLARNKARVIAMAVVAK